MSSNPKLESKSWWKYGHMWLVVGGPLVVVVASFFTMYLAVTSPNEIVSDHDAQSGGHAVVKDASISNAPAMQAFNHAQTGVIPPQKTKP